MGPSGARARLRQATAGALAPALACCALFGCGHWSAAARPPRQASDAAEPAGPRRGVFHTVQAGETLYRISRTYGVPVEELARENALPDAASISEGQALFIPGGGPDEQPPATAKSRKQPLARLARVGPRPGDPALRGLELAWPVRGVLFSGFGARARDQHDGIDLAAPEGTAVLAAAAGTVLFAGEQRGYGRIVLVGHAGALGDVVTVYAHNSENLVESGARVERGQPIARVGHTGNATGPHLHFEVRVAARPRDPLGFLR